jgi:hypothetical protein
LNPSVITPPTTRNYAPIEVERQPLAPIRQPATPPAAPASPPAGNPQSNLSPPRINPPLPFVRPATPQPASTAKPQSKLQAIPDPDTQKLDLRKSDIPQLISPNDRHT